MAVLTLTKLNKLRYKKKILLIGYSNISRKRIIKTFIRNKIKFAVASKSYKKKINGAYKQFNNYNEALKFSDADIVYLSIPNSMHFDWAKKALNFGYHLIVDKPITTKLGEVKKLTKIANKKGLLLSEAVFFNYHDQFYYIKKFCKNLSDIDQIFVNFTIPMPKKNSLLLSNSLGGGAWMDMGPYTASIHRIFFKEKLKKKSVILKKNHKGLITSFDIFFKYNTKVLIGTFRFGREYQNNIFIKLKNKTIQADRLFSPPDNMNLIIKINVKGKFMKIKIKKNNCFENYLSEVLKNINKRNYNFYVANMIKDENLRLRTIS